MYPVPPKAETQGRTEAYLGLKRLQTDYVDLYQIHWPDRYLPLFGNTFYDPGRERAKASIEEQLEAFAGFVKAGTMDQLKEDIDVEGVTLPEGVLAEIDAIHLRYPNPAI